MFRFLKSQYQPLKSQTPPRQLQRRKLGSIQCRCSVGKEEYIKGGLTAEHHLQRAQSLSDVSNAERGESAYRGGYTGESKERCIWRADRHIGRRMCGWGGVRTSSRSSASSSERRVNYRIRESADAVRNLPQRGRKSSSLCAGSTTKYLGLRNPGMVGNYHHQQRL